ncbi:IucA/IucC family protein [Bacillus sp. DX1.1]|uniref:IucA/IucC family protein n=1 Tax=unclassified Bacillus (in: firmicutes) TaxID=185979 RepID=UPI002570953C|nr:MULTISPECIES: IucA/IucC family protein [unclassified Bacillus (in: firmicutes)]MDM5154527.1 IucA/IucC family protein [Bacillus sp. DX1.1]WJE83424.1 IucA/IucC family protein [Bacillus sp. DX3.1]
MMEEIYHTKVIEAVQSKQYIAVRRRVFRQLIESLIYEGVLSPIRIQEGEYLIFTIQGLDESGDNVAYQCRCQERMTFERIRLAEKSIVRIQNDKVEEVTSIAQFLNEVFRIIKVDEVKLHSFIEELEQTIFKDTIAQYERSQKAEKLLGKTYDELESGLIDGHPYHPSYKARIGFQYRDHFQYGFEFNQLMKLIWIAVHDKHTYVGALSKEDFKHIVREEVGERKLNDFCSTVRNVGCNPNDYTFMPVHPWQWENYIIPNYAQHIQKGNIIFIGKSEDEYYAQQSMRTLRNASNCMKPYVKLSMNLLNTSTVRTLKPHSVVSAPIISNWLKELVANDPYLRDEARVILLQEFAGVTYDPPEQSTYGSLGCIWRESIHQYLEGAEEAIPFNALYAKELDGTPIIQPWLEKNGIESWLRQLIKQAVLPIVHLLVEQGIALESHGQNMILIHEQGTPIRIALKDFHEGIEFYRPYVKEPERCPDFAKVHPMYANGHLNDFFEMDSIKCLQEMILDALFLFNVGELAMLLQENYGFKEEQFWLLIVEELENHLVRFSHLRERFEQLQLYAPTFQAEQLTKRRLYADVESLVHEVSNPLYTVRQLIKQ